MGALAVGLNGDDVGEVLADAVPRAGFVVGVTLPL